MHGLWGVMVRPTSNYFPAASVFTSTCHFSLGMLFLRARSTRLVVQSCNVLNRGTSRMIQNKVSSYRFFTLSRKSGGAHPQWTGEH